MSEYISIANLFVSVLIIPVLTYVVRMEKRITRLETIIEIIYTNAQKRGGEVK